MTGVAVSCSVEGVVGRQKERWIYRLTVTKIISHSHSHANSPEKEHAYMLLFFYWVYCSDMIELLLRTLFTCCFCGGGYYV